MSAFSTVGDVFSDPEFSAPGNSFLWGLGALEEQNRECTGFLITIPANMITEMRGADVIVFELILICNDCNLMRFFVFFF